MYLTQTNLVLLVTRLIGLIKTNHNKIKKLQQEAHKILRVGGKLYYKKEDNYLIV